MFTRPDDSALRRALDAVRTTDVTYAGPVPWEGSAVPAGFVHVRDSCSLGNGRDMFRRATAALQDWAAHRGSGIAVLADGPLAPGTNVALGAPLPLGTVLAACRIADVVDEPHRYGFTYTTLPMHPAQGAERFLVSEDGDEVTFTVEAVSRPQVWFTRLAPPATRWFQRRASRGYLDAMRAAVTSAR